MKESFSNEYVRVFDDVLPKDTFEKLWLFMNLIAYQSTAAGHYKCNHGEWHRRGRLLLSNHSNQ